MDPTETEAAKQSWLGRTRLLQVLALMRGEREFRVTGLILMDAAKGSIIDSLEPVHCLTQGGNSTSY